MILLLGCMYKHTYALLEAGQPAQQTHYKRNSKEVEHELLLGFTHQAVMGGGKEENSTKQWSKICCEHTILRNVASFLGRKKKSSGVGSCLAKYLLNISYRQSSSFNHLA